MNEITLALGGGGVKGYAHIGVLRALERHGFQIRSIAGTSAGGMVGAVYAAGHSPDEMEKCLLEVDQARLYGRLPDDGPSMMGLAGVVEFLTKMLGERTFRETRLPFAVTAVNIQTARLLALQRGRLLDAVLATIAVPGVFPPRQWEDALLIDGGILDPVPVSLARYLGPGLPAVAVVLSPPLEAWQGPTPPRLLESLPFLANYISRLRVAKAFNIFLRSIDIAGAELSELRLELDQPEVIVRPRVPQIGFLDTVDVPGVIRLGEEAVEAALPDLRRAVGWQGRLQSRLTAPRFRRAFLTWKHECD